MKYPAREEFLDRFGLEPFKVDPEIGLFVYRAGSEGQVEVEFSFSLVMRSFQALISIDGGGGGCFCYLIGGCEFYFDI